MDAANASQQYCPPSDIPSPPPSRAQPSEETPGQGESSRSAHVSRPNAAGDEDQTSVPLSPLESDLESERIVIYAYRVKNLATKASRNCEEVLEVLTNSCLRTELLCIANIKHRYGPRSSSRFLGIFDAVLGYLYPTPRHQKKLTKDTIKLVKDWNQLLQQFKVVELLLEHLFEIAIHEHGRINEVMAAEASEEEGSPASRELGHYQQRHSLIDSPGDVWLYRTTNPLVVDAELRLEEIIIQDVVMRRRALALNSQWRLLLAQMKQLDQVDALYKKRAARFKKQER